MLDSVPQLILVLYYAARTMLSNNHVHTSHAPPSNLGRLIVIRITVLKLDEVRLFVRAHF